MNIANQAWAAGFFDGEGYIGTERSGKNLYLVVSISQADITPLARIREWFGGDIQRNTKKLHVWHWRLHGEKAANMLSVLVPYLVVKREQAVLAVQFQKLINPTAHRTLAYSTENSEQREAIAKQIKALKRPWLDGVVIA